MKVLGDYLFLFKVLFFKCSVQDNVSRLCLITAINQSNVIYKTPIKQIKMQF